MRVCHRLRSRAEGSGYSIELGRRLKGHDGEQVRRPHSAVQHSQKLDVGRSQWGDRPLNRHVPSERYQPRWQCAVSEEDALGFDQIR